MFIISAAAAMVFQLLRAWPAGIFISLLLLYARSCNRRRVCVVFCSVIFRSPLSRVHTPIDAARQHLFDVLQPLSDVCWKSCQHVRKIAKLAIILWVSPKIFRWRMMSNFDYFCFYSSGNESFQVTRYTGRGVANEALETTSRKSKEWPREHHDEDHTQRWKSEKIKRTWCTWVGMPRGLYFSLTSSVTI